MGTGVYGSCGITHITPVLSIYIYCPKTCRVDDYKRLYEIAATMVWKIASKNRFKKFLNKKAVLSQGEPRDAAVIFDKYRILQ